MAHTLLLLSRDHAHYEHLLQSHRLPDLRIWQASEPDHIERLIGQADILLGEPADIAPWLASAKKLKWVQSTYAGIDALLAPDLRRDYCLTNVRGIFGPLMSEYVFGHLLSLTRHLPLYREQQHQHSWQPIPYRPLTERRILIIGTGSIGQHLASTARHFGMQVWGINRRGREVPGFDDIFQIEALQRLLPEADVVVSIIPATHDTYHLFDTDTLACCKPGSILFNVGRGNAIDEAALVDALKAGRPGVAVLDVFEQEPLPAGHPLWHVPNLIITPHNSAWSLPEQVFKIFERNYIRFQEGLPLDFQINFEQGY